MCVRIKADGRFIMGRRVVRIHRNIVVLSISFSLVNSPKIRLESWMRGLSTGGFVFRYVGVFEDLFKRMSFG